jgi:crossover junction endodeoxyribonuclease RuvC
MSAKPVFTRVLAFDPGYERLGVAVLERQKGKEVLLYSDCVRTPPTKAFEERLHLLGKTVEALIKAWKPNRVALEQVFFEKNAKTAMQIAEVRGMIAYLAARNNITVLQYAPGAVKVAITGYGRSDKGAVAAMISRLVRIEGAGRLDDELDAIAVGITCLASER